MMRETTGCFVRHPAGATSISLGGETYEADDKGLIEIPHAHLSDAQSHGFVLDGEKSAKPVLVEGVGHNHDNPGGPRGDGPTVAEWVASGYRAENYPPQGYSSKSTAEEIAAAIDAQGAKKYADMTKEELLGLGMERDLPVKSKMNKDELIAMLGAE